MSDCTDDCDLADICSQRHWSIYWLIIFGSVVLVGGRLLSLGIPTSNGETTVFMSANDRSRWATVRSLGDHGTYVIDEVIESSNNRVPWDTVDKVKHLDRDGNLRTYSSKPTLYPTMIAGLYWLLTSVSGLDLTNDTIATAKIILVFTNVIPWLMFLWLLGKTLERIQVRDWTRYFVVTVAGFGTFLSTFAITLNNHLPAAIAVMASLYCLLLIVNYQKRDWQLFAFAGLLSAFAVTNELPALSFFAFVSVICLVKSPQQFLLGFAPAAILVAASFFGTNQLAHDDWRPPYLHKGDGILIETVSDRGASQMLDQSRVPSSILKSLSSYSLTAPVASRLSWPFQNEPNLQRWKIESTGGQRFTVVRRDNGESLEIRSWDNWYDYPGSYWTGDRKSLVDQGQTDTVLYLFHVLFGHHGIFSLTPIWLLSLAGMFVLTTDDRLKLRWLAIVSVLLSIVVIGFYVCYVPSHDRNYGGSTSTFRWALWLAPFWLICLAPIVDWMGKSKRGRAICFALFLISALSAQYSANNPWTHPWLYEIWQHTGLPK